MMNKIWYVLFDGHSEGPFSLADLKEDDRVTPDTWAWKEGFESWVKIRDIQELKELFEDHQKPQKIDEEISQVEKDVSEGELILDMRQEPPYFLWVLIAFVSLVYVILRLYAK